MNSDELSIWRDSVGSYLEMVSTVIEDRKTLENLIGSHLKYHFGFDRIEFSRDFRTVKLYFKEEVKPNDLDSFKMEWAVKTGFTDDYGCGVIIEVYPFEGF